MDYEKRPRADGEMPTYAYNAGQHRRDWWGKLKELQQYRYLLRNLIARDLKVRYKNSVLGILWSVLNPLFLMVVFTIVFSVLAGNEIRDYPIFVLTGLIPWNFFSGSLTSGTTAITSNSGLVKKVYFPRELLPAAAVLSNLVNFLFAFLVLIVFLYIFGIGLTVHALWVPLILLTQIIFTLGLGLLLGSLTVFYRDVLMILEVVMLAWFFLTPVFYSLETFGQSSTILGFTFVPAQLLRWINPMASIIDGYRTVLWGTYTSNGPVAMYPPYLLRTFVTSVIVFVIGYGVFNRLNPLFGEKL
ncbi:MAG: ABC transporter permease [Anaerolineales bacterium]|uniref:ABC transporter permease n=1 Tax=Promineifilum sp. TaxID=2664178 RepID=UPI001D208BE3|nr:ABC transporter permease [Anaerolineales bacterium]MCO5180047.1 ABC transporter permease [Promineifilum sp.]